MGEIVKGIHGGVSGKVGNVIGSSWRGIDYLRSLARRSSKPATEAQTSHRQKFALIVGFLAPLKDLLEQSFKGQDLSRATGYNLAVHYNLTNAVTGEAPEFGIDLSKVVVSRGTLVRPYGVTVQSMFAGRVDVSWPALDNGLNAFGTDKVNIVLYNTAKKVHVLSLGGAQRSEGTVSVEVPPEFSGDQVEGLIWFSSADGRRNSPNAHFGPEEVF